MNGRECERPTHECDKFCSVRPSAKTFENANERVGILGIADGTEKEKGEKDEMEEEDQGTDNEAEAGAVRRPRYVRDVNLPSKAEVERHKQTHLPSRNWCPFCMKGRGKEAPHLKSKGEGGELPGISLEFCFPSREGANGGLTILVARVRHSKMNI